MKITLIAAISNNGVIGVDNKLPWKLPDDLKHFKRYTEGKTVVMGAKTYKSIGSKPLPNRDNIVVSSKLQLDEEGVTVRRNSICVVESCQEAKVEELVVIGGGQLYKDFMYAADKLVITHVNTWCSGGVFFPEIKEDVWKRTDVHYSGYLANNEHTFEIVTYERR